MFSFCTNTKLKFLLFGKDLKTYSYDNSEKFEHLIFTQRGSLKDESCTISKIEGIKITGLNLAIKSDCCRTFVFLL